MHRTAWPAPPPLALPPPPVDPPRKPAGGYQLVPVVAVALAWWAYRTRLIRIADLRVWLAALEMQARRACVPQTEARRFGLPELQRLTGLAPRRTRESLRRLQAARLLTWTDSTICLTTAQGVLPSGDAAAFGSWLAQIPNHKRSLPIPRRVLRLICRGARPALIATVLGHLLRCFYIRNGRCQAEGRVKASWIAAVFGVGLRRVKEARGELTERGWLLPVPTQQWALNRWGACVRINLAWAGPGSPPSAICRQAHAPLPASSETARPASNFGPHPAPPESDRCSPSGMSKNQQPASGRPSGVCPGTAGRTDPRPPSLAHIVPDDLADTRRLLSLYEQAAGARLLSRTERDRLRFLAAAERARAVGTRNPCGLFARLVRAGLWHFATLDHEAAANARLKSHLYGPVRGPARAMHRASGLRECLSDDARLVRAVRELALRAGYRGEAFPLLKRERPEWTRARWDTAAAELAATPAASLGARAPHGLSANCRRPPGRADNG